VVVKYNGIGGGLGTEHYSGSVFEKEPAGAGDEEGTEQMKRMNLQILLGGGSMT
jgi:hypothetical protein